MTKTLRRSLTVAVLVLAAALAMFVWLQSPQPSTLKPKVTAATLLPNSDPLPAFTLEGKGGPFTQDALGNHWTFLFFGYTQCPDICPTAMQMMKDVKARIDTAGGARGPRLQVVFVSVDPQRDTRELLDQYAAAFDPSFIALRGDDNALAPLQRVLGVFFQRNDASDKQHYTVDHSAGLYLIGPEKRLVAYFSQPQQAQAVAEDFLKIRASAS